MILSEDLFIDTSAWVALADRDDARHKRAAALYPSLFKTFKVMLTTNLIIAETYIILLNELGHKAALNFLSNIKASPRIFKVYSNEEIEADAEKTVEKYIDQGFSFTDAVSFAVMKRHNIQKAFCFDKHFQAAGFIKIP